MAIVKYTLVNGQFPAGITDHGHFKHHTDKTYVGIGDATGTDSDSKTELSINELKAYVKTLPRFNHVTFTDANNPSTITAIRDYTDSEIETIVDDWCSARGIS